MGMCVERQVEHTFDILLSHFSSFPRPSLRRPNKASVDKRKNMMACMEWSIIKTEEELRDSSRYSSTRIRSGVEILFLPSTIGDCLNASSSPGNIFVITLAKFVKAVIR